MSTRDDATDDLAVLVRTLTSGVMTAGAAARTGIEEAVDFLVGGFIRLRVQRALDSPSRRRPDVDALRRALEPATGAANVIGSARLATRLPALRRSAAVRRLLARTPTGRLLGWAPLVVDTLTGNVRAIDAAARHLVARAQAAGVEPDLDRTSGAVVHALTGRDVHPDTAPDHGALIRRWLVDSGRRAAPLGLGRFVPTVVSPAVVVAALEAFDATTLRAEG